MFVISIVLAIVLGYSFGGKLINLEKLRIRGVYLVFISFAIEFGIVMGIRNEILTLGKITYLLDILMYLLILVFIVLNRKNSCLLLMGAGFLLNAIPIFLNGGAMPVSMEAINITGLNPNIGSEGLYTIINSGTKLWFLGDIIPVRFINTFIVSIGDIFAALGLVLLIATGMRGKKYQAHNR